MIEVDISNIWGSISLRDLLSIEKDVFQAHLALTEENTPWLTIPAADAALLCEMGAEIRECSEILVVLGGDGFSQALPELFGAPQGLKILHVPASFRASHRSRLLTQLEGRPYSICLCGETRFWDTLLLRELKWILERRYGTDEANARIHRDPFGLLALAAGGLDMEAFLTGLRKAAEEMDLRSYENPVWLYAASRHLLARNRGELLIYDDPDLAGLGRWWQQLFGSGVPVSLCRRMEPSFCGEHGLDTMLRFTSEETACPIAETAGDPGDVNFLAGRTLPQLEEEVWDGLLEANLESGVPALAIQCGAPDACTLGWLFWLFRLSAALCARLANPDSTGLEEMMLRHLGKPET